jgi:hypothetical protein
LRGHGSNDRVRLWVQIPVSQKQIKKPKTNVYSSITCNSQKGKNYSNVHK